MIHIKKKIKKMRVYKLSTDLTTEKNRQLSLNLSDEDMDYLSTLDMGVSVDLLDENETITTIMVSNSINIEKIKFFLSNNNVIFEVEDITEIFASDEEEDVISEKIESLTQEDIFEKFGIYE